MLPKLQKINREDFPKDFRKGRTYNSLNISLSVTKNKVNTPSKFSFVSSSKVSKKAIKRNLLRRRGYYIIRKNKTQIKPGFICVLFFKKGAVNLNYKEIEDEILTLLKKSKLL